MAMLLHSWIAPTTRARALSVNVVVICGTVALEHSWLAGGIATSGPGRRFTANIPNLIAMSLFCMKFSRPEPGWREYGLALAAAFSSIFAWSPVLFYRDDILAVQGTPPLEFENAVDCAWALGRLLGPTRPGLTAVTVLFFVVGFTATAAIWGWFMLTYLRHLRDAARWRWWTNIVAVLCVLQALSLSLVTWTPLFIPSQVTARYMAVTPLHTVSWRL